MLVRPLSGGVADVAGLGSAKDPSSPVPGETTVVTVRDRPVTRRAEATAEMDGLWDRGGHGKLLLTRGMHDATRAKRFMAGCERKPHRKKSPMRVGER